MSILSLTWLTDDLIDFEYKKYTLLAYLQNVQEKFNQHRLYPQLSELIMHFENLVKIKENKQMLYDTFPKTPTGINIDELKITYQKLVKDDELMNQLSEIIHYAIPQLDRTIDQGKEVYNFVEENISFDEVGLMPLYQKEGYVLLTEQSNKLLTVYRYNISLITHHQEEYRSISTSWVTQEIKSVSNTANAIKLRLARQFQELPNPATFLITSRLKFPLKETLLPIAKRILLRNTQIS